MGQEVPGPMITHFLGTSFVLICVLDRETVRGTMSIQCVDTM